MPLNLIYTFSILIFVREVMNNVSSAEKKVRDQRQIRVGVLETCEDWGSGSVPTHCWTTSHRGRAYAISSGAIVGVSVMDHDAGGEAGRDLKVP
jgi:hypothetical protein